VTSSKLTSPFILPQFSLKNELESLEEKTEEEFESRMSQIAVQRLLSRSLKPIPERLAIGDEEDDGGKSLDFGGESPTMKDEEK